MDNRKDFYKIAKKYCGNELVHGMPHIERILKNFKKITAKGENQKILKAVELAVIIHDIGRKLKTPEKKHGLVSKEILESEYASILNKIPKDECEWIKYAIDGHTNGMEVGKLKTLENSKNICLALLLALDNMDAIGKIGVHRDFQDLKDEFMKIGDERKDDKKQEYLLDRLLRNYSRIEENVNRLEKIKKMNVQKLLKKYKALKKEQEDYILKLIRKGGKLEIRDIDIKKVLTVKKGTHHF